MLRAPTPGIAIDKTTEVLYVADTQNQRIRKISSTIGSTNTLNASTARVTTFAGSGLISS
jgi:DNA-binding beta-propeller fold protein YncE